jgi:hypothetical protein
MADIVSELASRCGISPDLARTGLGAALALLKKNLSADNFAKVSAAVPGADRMVDDATQAAQESSGGALSAVTGAVSKLFGGTAADLISKLTQFGFSADQIQAFLPAVLEFLKGKLPGDLMKQVSGLLPAPEAATK